MATSYRHAFKATLTLSGAQLIEAVFSLVRAKVIAVCLGPVGIAMNSIYLTALNTFYQMVSMGMPQSAVRDISQSQEPMAVIGIFRKVMNVLAISGLLLLILGSRFLSNVSFGQEDHTTDFIILSIGLMALVLSYANITILQGTKKLAYLAKTTVLSSVISLIFAIPCYYYLSIRGISLAITLGFVITLVINTCYVQKTTSCLIPVEKKLGYKEAFKSATPMLKLGIVIMLSTVVINIFTYTTNVMIRYFGSLEDVGYYQAAISVTSRNFAILSAVMAADFYPRLSALINKRDEFSKTMSEQGEVLLLAIGFTVSALIVFAPVIVPWLFDTTFELVKPLIRVIAYSFVFRVVWLTVSYVALAQGDKYTYLKYDALIGNGVYFVLNVIAYYYFGLTGLGYSSVAGSIFVSILLTVCYHHKYGVAFEINFWKLFAVCLLFASAFLIWAETADGVLYWLVAVAALAIYAVYTLREIKLRTKKQ